MSNDHNSANKVLTKSGLNTPPWRKLRGGAHLHATKGYRVSRSTYRTRHAGVVDDAGTGGPYRAVFKRGRTSYAQRLMDFSHGQAAAKAKEIADEVTKNNAEIAAS